MDRVRNEEVRRRVGLKRELEGRVDQRVLSWFRHVERMNEDHMPVKVSRVEVSRARVWGRPRLGWMDSVKFALGNRGLMVEVVRQCEKDRTEWRALVHM